MTHDRLRVALVLGLFTMITPISAAQRNEAGGKDAQWIDLDRDGLDDRFEQQLMAKFMPAFLLSRNDCDVMPAEFESYAAEPQPVERNGTIYGQVFERRLGRPQPFIEIHYYHLWSRDCGSRGHTLDAEHIAALVSASRLDAPLEQWKALYWYAGAHEDTLCDLSSAARAVDLGAEDQGPEVWISSEKHASYLRVWLCSGGCGADHCTDMAPLNSPKLVNIGELRALLNGALWARSKQWPMASKFATDFDDIVLGQLLTSTTIGPIEVKPYLHKTQAVLSAADSTSASVAASGQRTGESLVLASEHTGHAIGTSDRNTKAALTTAGKETGQALETSTRAVKGSLRKAVSGVSGVFGPR
jgi:hypothetical protein